MLNKELTINECDIVSRLQWRYATKKFDASKKIAPEVWQKLEESLILSPSSFGLQPWKFVVITDPAVKAKLPPISWNQQQVVDCSHLVVICRLESMTLEYVENYVDEIARVRAVNRDSLAQYRNYMVDFVKGSTPERLEEWMSRQCYIALGVLMTSASLLGVDNCPMEGMIAEEYDKVLGLRKSESKSKTGLRSLVLCALGYRAEDDKYAQLAKVRFPASRVVMHV